MDGTIRYCVVKKYKGLLVKKHKNNAHLLFIPVAPKKLPISISLTRPRILLSIFIIITNKLDLNIIQPHNIKFIFFKLYINYSVFKEIQYT